MNPLEILRRTPKDNCGECGFPTCLAFAAAVSKTGVDLGRCSRLDREGLSEADTAHSPAPDHDLELIRHLRGKVAGLDLAAIAEKLGAVFDGERLAFRFLGREVLLDASGVTIDGAEPEDPRDQILLYNYVHSGGGEAPSLDWVGMESLPNSISKVRTLKVYCEDRLARLFTGRDTGTISSAAAEMDGREDTQEGASLALVLPVLPRLPQKIVYWEESGEDGFAASVKVLFDRRALDFLDLESLVFSAERMCDRFTAILAG